MLEVLGEVPVCAFVMCLHTCLTQWRIEEGGYDSVAADLSVLQAGFCFAVKLNLKALLASISEAVLA